MSGSCWLDGGQNAYTVNTKAKESQQFKLELHWIFFLSFLLIEQRNPTLLINSLQAPISRRWAKSSLPLNTLSTGEEKANSGKVQDWRQRKPHVRNSFLITGICWLHHIKKESNSDSFLCVTPVSAADFLSVCVCSYTLTTSIIWHLLY